MCYFKISRVLLTAVVQSFSSQPNNVYVLHLYTCGMGLGNPDNRGPDAQLISEWDNPEAFNLWVGACGVNVSLIAVDVIGMVTSINERSRS